MAKKYNYEFVKKYIEEESNSCCKLISEEYINIHAILTIQCRCGEIFKKSFAAFKNNNETQCQKCRRQNYPNKIPFEKIVELLSSLGYTVLSNSKDYKNIESKVEVQCKEESTKHYQNW